MFKKKKKRKKTYKGNVTLIKTPNTSTKYEYDILGRLSKVTDKNNLVTKYTYDSVGNLIKRRKGKWKLHNI